MYQNNPVLVQTSNVGGSQGNRFNDAELCSNWPAVDSGNLINPAHPINSIEIRSGWVVDSITVTYSLADGSSKTLAHGAQPSKGQVVTLGPNEIIAAVYGWAGQYDYYKASLLIQMSMDVFDTKTAVTRTVGPYGGSNGTAGGQVFHYSDPLALAGFETNGSQTGISGLSVIKNSMAE